jgi:hypothetical protein
VARSCLRATSKPAISCGGPRRCLSRALRQALAVSV